MKLLQDLKTIFIIFKNLFEFKYKNKLNIIVLKMLLNDIIALMKSLLNKDLQEVINLLKNKNITPTEKKNETFSFRSV